MSEPEGRPEGKNSWDTIRKRGTRLRKEHTLIWVTLDSVIVNY